MFQFFCKVRTEKGKGKINLTYYNDSYPGKEKLNIYSL